MLVPVTVAVSEAELLVEVDEDEVAVEVEAGSAVSVASETVVVVPCEARTTMEVPSWVTTVTIGAGGRTDCQLMLKNTCFQYK